MERIELKEENALPQIHDFLASLQVDNVVFALDKPVMAGYLNPNIRLMFVTPGGNYRIKIVLNNEIQDYELTEGTLLCCLPFAGMVRLETPYKTVISVVPMKNSTRFVYFGTDTGETVYWFHSRRLLSPGGNMLLHGLLSFANEDRPKELVNNTAKALVSILKDDLNREEPFIGKAQKTYREALYLMQDQFQNHISRESIAAQLKITPHHLSRLFKNFGIGSFIDTLTRIRLEYAIELLRYNFSIDEIAERSGFQNGSYFIRVFKKYHGVTPTQFRS